jgi:dipeptidyl aminopeptidase/acylaminoacyl peptidase
MVARTPPEASTDSADWEARFRAPRTLWVEVAPDRPERGIACTNRSGAYQIERWEVETGTLEPITDDPSGKTSAWLSPDGEWVVWHADRAGNEFGHFVARRWAGGEPIDLTPDQPEYTTFAAAFSRDGWFAASIIRDDLAQLFLLPGSAEGFATPIVIDPGSGFVQELRVSADSGERPRVVAVATTAGEGLSLKLRFVDASSGAVVGELSSPPGAVTPVEFARDGRLLGSTTSSGEMRPFVLEPSGMFREYELSELDGDVVPLSLSPDDRFAVVVQSNRSIQTLHVLDLETGTARELDTLSGTVWLPYVSLSPRFLPDGSLLVIHEAGGTLPEVITIDAQDGRRLRTLIAAPDVAATRPFRSVNIPSTEGALIQGWLGEPEGDGPFPTVLEIHGGPQAHETDRFHAPGQAWIDRGFAFLTLNYRGSTGFGREYEQAIWGRVGELELADMVAARDWLVGEGIARPDAIAVTGGSYGGYMTLLALGGRPDLWAAGVAYVAIADWRLMYEDGIGLREYQEALFAGTPDEKPELYAAASPITYVAQLAAPLLIIQGRNDPRCPSRQLEVYADEARRLGKDVEVDWFEAGHGHGGIETRIAWQRQAMEFVERVLAGSASRQT